MRNSHYWIDKEERAREALLHTERMQKKFSKEINECVQKTTVYLDEKISMPKKEVQRETKIVIEDLDTVSAIFKHKEENMAIAALNFSSYKEPGGMFLKGSKAQEECLCHESILYNVLKEFSNFYTINCKDKNKALYRNHALYTPDVIFSRNGVNTKCGIITCASPNKFTAKKYYNVSDSENYQFLNSRIKYILDISAKNGIDTLILGAYGCGAFGQDARDVASIFKEALKQYHFNMVIFAIPDGKDRNLRVFREIFKQEGNKVLR